MKNKCSHCIIINNNNNNKVERFEMNGQTKVDSKGCIENYSMLIKLQWCHMVIMTRTWRCPISLKVWSNEMIELCHFLQHMILKYIYFGHKVKCIHHFHLQNNPIKMEIKITIDVTFSYSHFTPFWISKRKFVLKRNHTIEIIRYDW